MKRRRLTDAQRKAIVRDYRRGIKLEVIAATHGTTAANVCNIARAAGCKKRSRRRRLTDRKVECAVARFLRAGGKITAARKKWRISFKTVARIRSEAGLPVVHRRGGGVPARVLAAIAAAGSATYPEIARAAGITSRHARNACGILRRTGLLVRTTPRNQPAAMSLATMTRAAA